MKKLYVMVFLKWVEPMADAGASLFMFHLEATSSPAKLVEKIKTCNMKVGIAIRPGTHVDDLVPFAGEADMILIMSVEPGFGGQKFVPSCIPKVGLAFGQLCGNALSLD